MDTRKDALQLAASAAIGALAMYLMDPDRGRRRRARLGNAMTDLPHRMRPEAGLLPHARRGHRLDLDLQESMPHSTGGVGLLSLLAGAAAAAYAWRRFGSGQGAADSRIEVSQSIEIDAPMETVFDLWSNYENFPRFMSNVEEVRPLGGRRSHWVVKGPAGSRVEFDSVLVTSERPRLLRWNSEPDSQVQHEGMVRLEPSGHGTRATVHMGYRPPAGALGHAVASLFGRNPDQELADDLRRMKAFIETGVPASDAAQRPGQTPLMTSEQAGARL
ncbi:SRPBCC family protein [Caldimonas tepidiphila]|uniref:SRPBCC family protein n=1 Tax=Caldimonas tepidiphila TaxID=2315841 RepID=UPI000E5AD7BA|nr:SRPBCC family protein [Caldimonas tepidiphila]